MPRAIDLEIDVRGQRHLADVHLEDALAADDVRVRHHDLPVEAAGPQQRRIEHVRAVGRGDQDDAFVRLEAVHLDEQLVQRLLALVVAAAEAGAAMTADRVDFVDEDDARRVLLRLLEHVAHAARADADEHLDEVGAGDREERHVRLAGDGAREQRLAGARRPDRAARRAGCARRAAGTSAGRAGTRRSPARSSLASSTPATSSNVTRPCASVRSFAFDLPKPSALPPVPCIWRMKKIHTARIRNIGNHETSMPISDWPPSVAGLAAI